MHRPITSIYLKKSMQAIDMTPFQGLKINFTFILVIGLCPMRTYNALSGLQKFLI